MHVISGENYVGLEDEPGHDPLEKRQLIIALDRPGYCVCTGNVPLENVAPRDIRKLHRRLGRLIRRAEERR